MIYKKEYFPQFRESDHTGLIGANGYPTNTDERTPLDLPPFQRFPKTLAGMEFCYTYTVQYTDLDKSRHMNNQKYIPLFLNAFDLDFHTKRQITDFEIHYLKQCFEKEHLSIWRTKREQDFLLAGVKEDGTLAVQASITFRKEPCSHA